MSVDESLSCKCISLQFALLGTLATAAVRPAHSASIAMGHVTMSRDSVTVCQALKGHCVMRVSIKIIITVYKEAYMLILWGVHCLYLFTLNLR